MEEINGLAIEFSKEMNRVVTREYSDGGVDISITDTRAHIGGRQAKGLYYAFSGNGNISEAIGSRIKKLLEGANDIMVVALGNPRYVADALGTAVLDKISLADGVCKLYPLCSGLTGIESYDVIKAVADRIKPSAIIAVDTLATAKVSRLGKVYQLTDAGITPGAGAGNARERLEQNKLGVKVLAVGVPLVINSQALYGREGEIFTLAEIDKTIKECSDIIANGINYAFS